MTKGKDRYELVKQAEVNEELRQLKKILGALNRYINENDPELVFRRKEILGSVRRGVVSRVRGGNGGFDIDINLVIDPPVVGGKHNGEYVHNLYLNGLRQAVEGTVFSDPEESSSVFTLKRKDRENSRVVYGADLAIVYYEPDGTMRYLRFHKENGGFGFERKVLPLDIEGMRERIIGYHGDDDIIRDSYIRNKNSNRDPNKHSFIIYVETIRNLYNRICRDDECCPDRGGHHPDRDTPSVLIIPEGRVCTVRTYTGYDNLREGNIP